MTGKKAKNRSQHNPELTTTTGMYTAIHINAAEQEENQRQDQNQNDNGNQ